MMRRRTHLKTQINKNRRGNPAHGGQLREQPVLRVAARTGRGGSIPPTAKQKC